MFVGREDELSELRTAIAAAKSRGTYVALVGEPGIGKTRLAEEASALATAAGFRVVWGRCWEAGGAPPFWPWVEALRELGIEGWERAGGEQFEVFDAVTRALRNAGDIAIVLDDLHAADRSSLLLLQFVARQLRFMHVLVIATYRDVEARMRDDVAALLAKPGREGKVLVLDRLAREDVALLANNSAMVDALYRASEGNPLFVHEMLQLVESRGVLTIPDGIRAVLAERINLVANETRHVLAIASVLGREFDSDVLGALVTGVSEALDEAVRAGLVSQTAPTRFRFSHVRIRDVLYDRLTDKASIHARLADVLSQRGADANEVAHHLFAAGERERAIEAAMRAAEQANQRFAFDEAAEMLERARALDADNLALALAHGTALIRAGRPEDGQRVCERVGRDPRATPEVIAQAALAHGQVYKFGKSDPTMVALLEEALAKLPPGDSPLRAQVMGRLAGAMQPAKDLSVPVAAARQAIDMARRIGDEATLAMVLASAGSAMQDVVDGGERLPNNELLVKLARAKGDPLLAARGHLRLMFDHLELGNVEAADASFREHTSLLAEHRNPRLHWPSALYRAMRADMAGRFAEADDHVAEARRLAERANDGSARISIGMHIVFTALVRDAIAELHAAGPVLKEWAYQPGVEQIGSALLALRLGRIDEARARSASVLDLAFHEQSSAGACVSELVTIATSREPREICFADVAPYAERRRAGVWTMTAVVNFGPVARPISALAATLDRWDDAERFATRAIEECLRQNHVPALARTKYEWGKTLLGRSRADGKQLVDEARATAEEIGMTALAANCRALEGITVPVDWPAATPTPSTSGAMAAVVSIDRDGDSWVVHWTTTNVRVRDSRGMQMIAELVTRIGDDVHVLDLAGGATADGGDAGEVLDRTAIEKYKKRIAELREQLEDAEDRNDLGRCERYRDELEALEDEISRAVGMGGRQRRTGSAVERARVNVQRRIKSAIGQLAQHDSALANHLTRSIRTGSFCSYVPRP